MGFIDRLGNLARGTARVQRETWREEGGLQGKLDQLRATAAEVATGLQEGVASVREGAAGPPETAANSRETAARSARATVPPEASAGPGPADPADPAAALTAELARLEAAFADGTLTRSELRRKQAEARSRLGGSGRRIL